MQLSSSPLIDTKEILSRVQISLILCFAFTGNCAVLIAYSYPSGFYLQFLKEHDIQSTVGTVAISLCQITTVIGPYVMSKFPTFQNVSLKQRSVLLCVISSLCSASLGYVDHFVEQDTTKALLLIGVARAFLGFTLGIFFVIVQGEIVDRYFKDNTTMMVVIGSGVYAGNTLGGIIGTEIFVRQGWTMTGPAVALINLLPLLFLPFMSLDVHGYTPITVGGEEKKRATSSLSWIQTIAFYVPDFVFFMNNVSFSVLTYVVPAKMVEYRGLTLDSVVFKLNMICCASIFLGLAFSFLTSKKLNVFMVLLGCNILFYLGCLLMYASTTKYFSFNYDFELSSLMVGFGDATITNLVIMSKFVMFAKWNIELSDLNLAQHATTIFNISDSLGYIVGAIVSGLTMPKSSEVPTFFAFSANMLATTVVMIFCSLVRKKDYK